MTRMVQNSGGMLREAQSDLSARRADEGKQRRARRRRAISRSCRLLLTLCLSPACLLAGCSVVKLTKETVRTEHVFSRSNRKIEKQMRAWAEEAWLCHCGPHNELLADEHFRCGFEAGFIRYLRTGDPNGPLMPPREYLKAKYVSIEGRAAVNRWMEGHALGMIAGEQSGYRELVKIPVMGAIAPDDSAMPVAESVVVDAVVDPLAPPMAPVDPHFTPSPPPIEQNIPAYDGSEEIRPTPEPMPPMPPAPEPTAAELDDAALDAFGAHVSRHEESDAPEETQERLVANEELWLPTGTTDAIEDDHLLNDSSTPLPGETNEQAIDKRELSQDVTAKSDDEFRWLGNLSPEPPDELADNTENASNASPADLDEQDVPDPPESESTDSWLHPPEPPAAESDEFGFPESPAELVIFEDEEIAEPTEPEPQIQQISNESRAGARRYELYKHFATATKPTADHIDTCIQPDRELDAAVESETDWPQLDKVMAWPDSE